MAIITELAVACTLFAPCLEEPLDYPAYIDDETGAKAEVDRLSVDNEVLSEKNGDLSEDIDELRRENDELRTELDKRKKKRREAKSSGGKTRSSDGSNRKVNRNVSGNSDDSSGATSRSVGNSVVIGQTKVSNEVLDVQATAYVAHCDTGCSGITKTGVDVRNSIYHEGKRIIAVDPSQIPLGSTVRVKSEGESFEAKAIDTGGDIGFGRIDILVESTEEAVEFGRQDVEVTVID